MGADRGDLRAFGGTAGGEAEMGGSPGFSLTWPGPRERRESGQAGLEQAGRPGR